MHHTVREDSCIYAFIIHAFVSAAATPLNIKEGWEAEKSVNAGDFSFKPPGILCGKFVRNVHLKMFDRGKGCQWDFFMAVFLFYFTSFPQNISLELFFFSMDSGTRLYSFQSCSPHPVSVCVVWRQDSLSAAALPLGREPKSTTMPSRQTLSSPPATTEPLFSVCSTRLSWTLSTRGRKNRWTEKTGEWR